MAITIDAHFELLRDVSLVDAYDEIGVYVLWSGKAQARPSYIGEGEVLKRFVAHLDKPWAARPLSGVIALLRKGTFAERKSKAEAVEQVLLHVADQVDRFPQNNFAGGKSAGLRRLVSKADHNVRTVRFVFTGMDPLLPPERTPMREAKSAVLRHQKDGWYVEHDWRLRPIRE